MSTTRSWEKMLSVDLPEALRKINRRHIMYLAEQLMRSGLGSVDAETESGLYRFVIRLSRLLSSELESLDELEERFEVFNNKISRSSSRQETEHYILEFAAFLGASNRELQLDRQAFKRWFGVDCMVERYQQKRGDAERRVIVLLHATGVHLDRYFRQLPEPDQIITVWHELNMESACRQLLVYPGDGRVREATSRMMVTLLRSHETSIAGKMLSLETIRILVQHAQDSRQSVYAQQTALECLPFLVPDKFEAIYRDRLQNPRTEDDMFVRHFLLRLLSKQPELVSELDTLLLPVLNDPAPYVRQCLAEHLPEWPENIQLTLWSALKDDSIAQVCAQTLLATPPLLNKLSISAISSNLKSLFQDGEKDDLVFRVALQVCIQIAHSLMSTGRDDQLKKWISEFDQQLTATHQSESSGPRRRWVSIAREHLWIMADNKRLDLVNELRLKIDALPISKRKKLHIPELEHLDDEALGRLLSRVTEFDFPLDVSRTKPGTLRLMRWYHFGFRLWRFIFEWRHPAPDKRQAHKHLIGRHTYGEISIPSNRVAEQSQTKVPGEPLFFSEEGGGRTFLPLVDELLSALDRGWPTKPLTLYSNEGITEIMPPSSLMERARAKWQLTRKFDYYARLRNWQTGQQGEPNDYCNALRNIGFTIQFRTYIDASGMNRYPENPKVSRFFTASFLPFPLQRLWGDFENYFFSVYQNTLQHLALFIVVVAGIFIGLHGYANIRLNAVRKRLPLSIGGWGTRGKSGTERLKSAIFSALGAHIVSKTTGCEAMFLHGQPHGTLRELFLFRPYDKATIWEQLNLMRLSDKLGAEVFLWECMGLTPSYVHILQRHWMRDDIATITNTYPDHEDLQGPAGYNIPTVMIEFIPQNSTVVTTEEEMYDILEYGSRPLNTNLEPVTWLDAAIIPPDILDRFPYEEHPNNIALVSRMATLLGIDRDFALKEMADNVVLDLGVLKTYPIAPIQGRRLQFVMGMSANERLGCMGNWTRMGFADHVPEKEPETWISTIVNNRADRVPRSKVFASILVNDIEVDQHYLIGTNIDGLMTYIEEAWEETYGQFSLQGKDVSGDQATEHALKLCDDMATSLRVPLNHDAIAIRLSGLLSGLSVQFDSSDMLVSFVEDAEKRNLFLSENCEQHSSTINTQIETWLQQYNEYTQITESIRSGANLETASKEFERLMWGWFSSKLVPVTDSEAPGEKVVAIIAEKTPPGLHNRIMGLQNIKGTGLDYVYRWQAWEACHKACTMALDGDPATAQAGIGELSTFREYGVLSEEYMKDVLEQLREARTLKTPALQAQVETISEIYTSRMDEVRNLVGSTDEGESSEASGWRSAWVPFLEELIDSTDAVKRRRQADLIYKELGAMRISHGRAALALQALTKRQKGNWLKSELAARSAKK